MKIGLVSLLIIFCCGCEENASINQLNNKKININNGIASYTQDVNEFEFDGCQYLQFGYGNGASVTHKGNCKSCLAKKQ